MTEPGPPRRPSALVRRLLWVDCLGAAGVGVAVITLSRWLSRLEGLPQQVVLFTGFMNLVYGAFSASLAVRATRPPRLLALLAVANLAWAPVCLGLLAAHAATATPFAHVHLVGEALYVGSLGLLEWRHRAVLVSA